MKFAGRTIPEAKWSGIMKFVSRIIPEAERSGIDARWLFVQTSLMSTAVSVFLYPPFLVEKLAIPVNNS
jgi:hypothetical protein